MYKIELQEKGCIYYYIAKNNAGQILHLEFMEECTQNHNFYFVMFYIGKRKKGFQYMETTGKDGIKSLLWAKNCILHFIDYIKKQTYSVYKTDNNIKHSIVIKWDDNRRRNVYYYGLKSLRFYYEMYQGAKVLMYKIK